MAAARAAWLLHNGRIASYGGQVYRAQTAKAEQNLAYSVRSMLLHGKTGIYGDLQADIPAQEAKLHITLAPEQQEAVITALASPVSIITGGPGTGKTLIQRVLLNIYKAKHPNARITCCAPTGRAARRMEQSTGIPATTIHKALGLLAGDDGT